MKINKMKYLFLAATTLTGLAACSKLNNEVQMTKSQIKRTSKLQPFDGRTGAKITIRDLSVILLKKQALKSTGIL